jgi:hypothetical protein
MPRSPPMSVVCGHNYGFRNHLTISDIYTRCSRDIYTRLSRSFRRATLFTRTMLTLWNALMFLGLRFFPLRLFAWWPPLLFCEIFNVIVSQLVRVLSRSNTSLSKSASTHPPRIRSSPDHSDFTLSPYPIHRISGSSKQGILIVAEGI